MEEIWKEYKTQKTDIEISNHGNVRGNKYFGIKFNESLITIKNGRRCLIHCPIFRLVWLVFNGPVPKGYVIHHIDHNKLNDNLNNLMLMTIAEHIRHHHTGMKMPEVTQEYRNKMSKVMKGHIGAMKGSKKYNNGEIVKHFYSDEEAISQGYIYRGQKLGKNKIEYYGNI